MLNIDLHKNYNTKQRQTFISCKANFQAGKTTAIYGKSGVGKSTILRIIAGLEEADKGFIVFNEEVWYNHTQKINVNMAVRKVGFVFQDYNLFPTMSVEGNLKYASLNNTITEQIYHLLELTNLSKLLKSYPNELSGGERQRVSILRALCQKSPLLLLDEPFSALDDTSIGEIMHALANIQKETGVTVLMVSHRKDVIFEMADSVVFMKEDGSVLQGIPSNLLTKSF